jgi:PERQ amino acid-rich with GYF domain-containing protein
VEGQHKAPQELAQLLDEKLAVCDQKAQTASASVTTLEDSSEVGKSPAKAPQAVTQTPSDQVALSDNSLPKSAWTKDDEGKGKRGTTASISLRAIQEAEAKKQQSLKASEREKERNRANITSEAKEDSQPFTASWGLPISQAGARNVNTPTKDVPALSAATIQTSSVTPVWTTPAKAPVVKKSMKEIQEEEERRKRQAAKDISVATTKRAYAETTNKASSIAPILLKNSSHQTPDAIFDPNCFIEHQSLDDCGIKWKGSFSTSTSTESGSSPYDVVLYGCIGSVSCKP